MSDPVQMNELNKNADVVCSPGAPLRVLWVNAVPIAFYEGVFTGWTIALEAALRAYYPEEVLLAFAGEYDSAEPKLEKDGTVFYPLPRRLDKKAHLRGFLKKSHVTLLWEQARGPLLRAVSDFRPDVIHVFGAEFPYGAVAKETAVPVVIHMMGFLNIYHPTLEMILPEKLFTPPSMRFRIALLSALSRALRSPRITREAFERDVMKATRFFMGRTEWDKNIVKYYAPGARYFHVPEVIRPAIVRAAGQWKYHFSGTLTLSTISLGDGRKGLEIILRTAKILKEIIGIPFTWRVTGRKNCFPVFEKKTGIRQEDAGVTFLGMIDEKQVVEELAGADFFIHPSAIDNSPNSLCEAQIVGCPVIASNVGGIPSLVRDGETGFLYPYNEPHALAFLIGNLAGDEKTLTRVSRAATEEALRRHDPKTAAGAVMETYREIAGES